MIDDVESVDATPLDLTPREVVPRSRATGSRKWGGVIVLVVVIAGLGFVLFQGLTNATVYFHNVDDAVAQRDELGTSRFRMQGNVIASSVDDSGQRMEFDIKYNDVVVHVVHTGDVPSQFKPAIPVVLEGAFDGDVYRSDRMLLKHDETYDEEHKTRTSEAERDARS